MTDLDITYMSLRELGSKRHPKNPKRHDLGRLAKSLEHFGFVAPLLMDERDGKLVAGHGRLSALTGMKAAGKKPPERIREEKGDWMVPVIRGVNFDTEADAEAYLIADNQLTISGGWDEDALVDLLEVQVQAGMMETIGFTEDYLTRLAEDREVEEDTRDADAERDELKEKKPDKRNLALDIIYSFQPLDASCFLAHRAGFKIGVISTNSALEERYSARYLWRYPISFIDNEFKDYNHERHLEMVKLHNPKYATVRDFMTKSQCEAAEIPYYDEEQILEWAAEIAEHTENLILIPKYDCFDRLPLDDPKYMLGYSVISSYGATPLPAERFKDHRVHLLGGAWRNQLGYLEILGDSVVSMDTNHIAKIAMYGTFVTPDGEHKQLMETFGFTVSNPFYTALTLSMGAIGQKCFDLFGDKDDPERKLGRAPDEALSV